jgi:putative transposase
VVRLHAEEIKISWLKRKHCCDNILLAMLWRTGRYEGVYLIAYSDGWEADINLT